MKLIQSPRPRSPWWLPVAGLPLSKWFLASGVTVTDTLLAVPAGLRLVREGPRQVLASVPLPFQLCGIFWLWASLAGLWAAHASPLPFSFPELLKSHVKLSFYLVTASLLAAQLATVGVSRAAVVLRRALVAHAALVVVLFTAAWVSPDAMRALPLPGHDRPWQGTYYHLRWFGDPSMDQLAFPRARGVLREPSTLAIVHTLGLGFLLLAPLRPPRPGASHLLILVSILLTFSFTGYGLLLVTLLLALWRWRVQLARSHLWRQRALLICLLLVLSTLLPAIRSTFEYAVARRIGNIAGGYSDFSSRARLVENWRAAWRMARPAWVTGVGLGNYDVALEEIRKELPLPQLAPSGTQGWNILAYCLATTGVLGVLLFLLPISVLARGHPTLGALLFVSLFAHVGVLEPVFWIPFALFVAAAEESRRLRAMAATTAAERAAVEPAREPRWVAARSA